MPIMTNQTKIPGWKLPGAIGWEGWPDVPVEFEKAFESKPENHLDPVKPVMSATGRLNFEIPITSTATSLASTVVGTVVNEIPETFKAISGLFTNDILQIRKEPPPPNLDEQKQKAEAAYSREQYQGQTVALNEARATASKTLEEEARRISGGEMGIAEVKATSSTIEVGISHVVSTWRARQEQIKAAAQAQEEQEVASTSPKGFMREGEMLMGTENNSHFTQVAG